MKIDTSAAVATADQAAGPAPAPAPEIAPGVEKLAGDMDAGLAGSGVVIEPIPDSIRHDPRFRAGLHFRVFLALAFTVLLIWGAVRGADWLDVFGGAVATAAFWTVTIAAFRGIRVDNLR
jgi:hypothetical protein